MKQRVDLCLHRYSEGEAHFVDSFSTERLNGYLADRELMITTEVAPTIAIARHAFGEASIKLILEQHLFAMARAFGVTASPEAINDIEDDIISGYPDLKITEILLAFKMMREGKFREGRNGEDNRAQMYGMLSSAHICDCLNRFRFEYRNPILARHESEQQRKQREASMQAAATPDERYQIFLQSARQDPERIVNGMLSLFLTPTDMEKITTELIEELKTLRLFKKRVEEHIADPDNAEKAESVNKGIAYINNKFPLSNV